MAIPEDIITSVSATNLKNVAEAPAYYSGLAMGNALAHQHAMQQVTLAATGAIVKGLTEVDTAEADAIVKTKTGNDLATQIAQLLAVLGGGQQSVKTAQTTPPLAA